MRLSLGRDLHHPMKSAKQRRQSRVIGPSLPWQCCFTKPSARMLVFYAVVSRHFGAGKLRQRIPGRSSFGPSCCMQALVSQLAGGERVHVVRCADLLGCVGVVARGGTQVAGRAGARYCSICFLPELRRVVDDDDAYLMRVNVGCYTTMLSIHVGMFSSSNAACKRWHSMFLLAFNVLVSG